MTYQRLSDAFGVASGAVVSGVFVSVIVVGLAIAHEFHAVQEDRVEERDEQPDPQAHHEDEHGEAAGLGQRRPGDLLELGDRKSTRLNSSHVKISYAVFCLKEKKKNKITRLHVKKENKLYN